MKNKLLVAFLAGMCVLLMACGGESNNIEGKSTVEVSISKKEEVGHDVQEVSPNEDKQEIVITQPVVEEPTVYTAKQEILDADWYSGFLQVNDKLVQLPLSLSELLAMGFSYEIDYGEKNKDYLFVNGEYITYSLLLDGNEVCTQSYKYTGDKIATLEDINPNLEEVWFSGIEETDLTFFLPGGVTLGDAMQVVEEKLGEPLEMNSNTSCFNYIYGNPSMGSNECEIGVSVSIDRDSQLVTSFRISRNIVPVKYEDFSVVTIEEVRNLQSTDVHALQILFSEEQTISGMGCETVFEKDGAIYHLKLFISASLQKYFSGYVLEGAGSLLYEDEGEDGRTCMVYDSGEIYCFKDPFVMKVTAYMTPLSKTGMDVSELYQEYIVRLGEIIQY